MFFQKYIPSQTQNVCTFNKYLILHMPTQNNCAATVATDLEFLVSFADKGSIRNGLYERIFKFNMGTFEPGFDLRKPSPGLHLYPKRLLYTGNNAVFWSNAQELKSDGF